MSREREREEEEKEEGEEKRGRERERRRRRRGERVCGWKHVRVCVHVCGHVLTWINSMHLGGKKRKCSKGNQHVLF